MNNATKEGRKLMYSPCDCKEGEALHLTCGCLRAPAPEIAALALHETREHHVVHLGGAINEARLAGVAVDPFENGVLRVAARAVELDCYIRGLVQGVGDLDLGHRHLLAGAVALVELPGGVHDQKAPDLDPLRHLAK